MSNIVPKQVSEGITDCYALAVWVYLNSRPDGCSVDVDEVRKHFGFGQRVWRRASKILRDQKLLRYVKTYHGTVITKHNPY